MINKKIYGQYFTNEIIADFMASWVMENKPKKLLEPAVGEGALIKAVLKIDKKIFIDSFDIDKMMCDKLKENINISSLNIENKDYLLTRVKKYDAIICNPPYNKFQKIKNRKELIKIFINDFNIKLSGYSNLCIYFLIKSLNELNIDGRCAYIIPYEFLSTGYGEVLKEYILKSKKLHSIIKFDNSIGLFDDATTTSCILFFENKVHEFVKFINIENIHELNNKFLLDNAQIYNYGALNSKEKWLQYFKLSFKEANNNLIKLKDLGQVKRGIATGNNSYFILNKQKIIDLKLSNGVCLPCITKSADIKSLILDKKEFKKLNDENKKVYIFNGKEAINKNDYAYITKGEVAGYNETYLTSHRKPWYALEDKKSAPILFSVFCRKKLKVIRNELMIKNLTTFHGFYFNNEVSQNFINIFFCYLLTPVAQRLLFNNKREYGDGLDKFEPNDLNNAEIIDITKIKEIDKIKILQIYDRLRNESSEKLVNDLNNIFYNYVR